MRITRRNVLLGLGACIGAGQTRLALAAAATERRFVVVLLRGALDGLAAVVPYGDKALADLRGELLPPDPGQPGGVLDAGGFFGLHPALAGLHGLYQANEALIVHAVAGDWRVRSHFEAQDCLESGSDHRLNSGWLNRVAAALPPGHGAMGEALAVGVSAPLLLRGPAPVASWAPHGFSQPAPGLYAAIAALNQDDPLIGPAIRQGLRARGFTADALAADKAMDAPGDRNAFPLLARAAGEMLAARDGPRIAALEIGGWDTHAAQTARLAVALKQLDAGLLALKEGLGAAWPQTAVVVVTEFGRTARMNGTKGTDHGTGSVALILGGAVAGGKIRATWPGLGPSKLFEDRDLAPTTSLTDLISGLLAEHLGLDQPALQRVFPGADPRQRLTGIIRA